MCSSIVRRANAISVLMFISAVSCNLRDDVKFYFSTEDQNRTELNYDNLEAVNVKNPTIFLIHGWTKTCNDSWVIESTEKLLGQGDYNVIAVDYAPISQLDYNSAVSDAKYVGVYTGELIANLYTNYSANLSNFQIVGHSLGAHIAGFTGKTVQNLTGFNISRITGLDPASPLYFPSYPEGRLASSDADIVVTVHTDGLVNGYYYQIGGIDFYPNGGTGSQPGCFLYDLVQPRCSHYRAPYYYVEALSNPEGFVATQCSDYLIYALGSCSGNNKITLGGNFTQSDFGKYYFKTNSESPYSLE